MSAELLRAVAEQGYTETTPIQAQAIPLVLEGRDLFGAAQTGTGKTAGFTLPMLQRLAAKSSGSTSPARHPIRALVLVPTRELADQVHQSVQNYGRHLKLRSMVIFGGVNINPQFDALRRGVDIVVATPGRLLDHVQQKTIDLRQVEIVVLDEADRMLDMGFIPDIRRILALLPKKRQNLLFSATFSDEIRKLAGAFLDNPATVQVARKNTPAELVSQVVHPVAAERKRELLAHLIKTNSWQQVLVFTKTKHGANRLAEQLGKQGIDADAIHGNKSQNARTRALTRFKACEMQVLVATDIAARGLDIDTLPHVVNYDMPNVPEDYVHRIGRTGRAGATGDAVSLVSREDQPLLAAIERLMNRRIEQKTIEGFEPGSVSTAQPQDERAERADSRRGNPRNSGQQRARGNAADGGSRKSASSRGANARSANSAGTGGRTESGRSAGGRTGNGRAGYGRAGDGAGAQGQKSNRGRSPRNEPRAQPGSAQSRPADTPKQADPLRSPDAWKSPGAEKPAPARRGAVQRIGALLGFRSKVA